MNYQKIYNQIVERAKSENRIKSNNVYYEAHHIIPKCLGGTGSVKNWKSDNNIVLLTAREHFLCHWLLLEMYPDNKKLAKAFFLMCNIENNNQKRYRPSSRIIEYAKIQNSFARKNQIGFWAGKNLSEETKQKLRIANIGKKHSQKSIEKMKEHKKGKKLSEDTINKIKKTKSINKTYEKMSKKVYDTINNIEYESARSCMKIVNISTRRFYSNIKNNIFKYIK